ncbi:hypothetical protein FAUST_3092 [Fusarium austroamericanum]|uniref:Uncharacterized protein n=1 Tax=Fusarium austroamericanum TaxID=282268 RepID=A0AAN6C5H0_FUSAU|nr:hypothetical protein FAUST_3092 [Fusarium austroamericanum]
MVDEPRIWEVSLFLCLRRIKVLKTSVGIRSATQRSRSSDAEEDKIVKRIQQDLINIQDSAHQQAEQQLQNPGKHSHWGSMDKAPPDPGPWLYQRRRHPGYCAPQAETSDRPGQTKPVFVYEVKAEDYLIEIHKIRVRDTKNAMISACDDDYTLDDDAVLTEDYAMEIY